MNQCADSHTFNIVSFQSQPTRFCPSTSSLCRPCLASTKLVFPWDSIEYPSPASTVILIHHHLPPTTTKIEAISKMSHATEAGPSNLVEVTSPEHFTEVMQQDLTRVSLLNFYAPWAEPCKQMNEVVKEIAIKYPQVLCLAVSVAHGLILFERYRSHVLTFRLALLSHLLR